MMDRDSLKHVEFYSKNKFEKLLHLIDFIIRICLGGEREVTIVSEHHFMKVHGKVCLTMEVDGVGWA